MTGDRRLQLGRRLQDLPAAQTRSVPTEKGPILPSCDRNRTRSISSGRVNDLGQARRHERAGHLLLFDRLSRNRDLAVLGVAQDQLGIGLAELDARIDLAVAGRDDQGVVVFLDRLAGLEQRVDQVVGLGTGADALQARARPARRRRRSRGISGSSDPCGERSPRPATGSPVRETSVEQLIHFLVRQVFLTLLEPARLFQSGDQAGLVAARGPDLANAQLGQIGGQGRREPVEGRGQNGRRSAQLQHASQHDCGRAETGRAKAGRATRRTGASSPWGRPPGVRPEPSPGPPAPRHARSESRRPGALGPAVLDECLDRRGANPPRGIRRTDQLDELVLKRRDVPGPIARTAASRNASSPPAMSVPIRARSPAGTTLRSPSRADERVQERHAARRRERLAVDHEIEHHRQVAGPAEPRDQGLNVLVLVIGDLALLEQGQERLDDRRRIDRRRARRSDAPAGRRNRTGRPGPRAARTGASWRAVSQRPYSRNVSIGRSRAARARPAEAMPAIWARPRTASSRTRGSVSSIARSARSDRGFGQPRLPERDDPRGRRPHPRVLRMQEGPASKHRLGDVERLVGPEGFQAVMFVLGVAWGRAL